MAKLPDQMKFRFAPGKATDVKDLQNVLAEDFRQSTLPIRAQTDKLLKHVVQVDKMIADGAEFAEDLADFFLDFSDDLEGDHTKKPLLIVGEFNRCKEVAKALMDTSFFNGKEFGHDFSILSIRLGTFAQVLQSLEDKVLAAYKNKNSGQNPQNPNRLAVPKEIETRGLFKNTRNRNGPQPATMKSLKAVKKRAQTMFIASRRLEKINPVKGSAARYTAIADDLNSITDFQTELDTHKSKLFDITSGKAEMTLTVEDKKANQFKAFYERAFGRNMNKEFDLGVETRFKKLFLDKVDVGDIKGGPKTINNKITEDLGILLATGKPKRTKSSSTTRKAVRTGPKPKKNRISARANRAKTGADFAKKALAVATIKRRTEKKESGNQSDFKELAELRLKIQKRLPAEVRRNMGRPALRNQTGRFSNSVHLTKLMRTPKGIMGDYSYMTNPYATFENEGKRRWPTGYNPKPLISKSIRNLALEIAGERFIRGRRT